MKYNQFILFSHHVSSFPARGKEEVPDQQQQQSQRQHVELKVPHHHHKQLEIKIQENMTPGASHISF